MNSFFDAFVNWVVPVCCVAVIGLFGALWHKYKALGNGLQSLLRAEIIRSYEKYIEKGYCPIYAKESLTRAYDAYHALGGNDVATGLYNEIMALQTEKPQT